MVTAHLESARYKLVVEIFADERHSYYERMARELYQRVNALVAPEVIYDWIKVQNEKVAPADSSSAVMQWEPSFEMYDAEIQRRIALAQLPEAERKLFNWPWASWNRLIDPIEPGMLAIAAAPDGTGKTIVGENLAEYWARKGQHVAFVHFELSRLIMLDRRTARHTSIARRQLKLAGDLTTKDLADIEEAKRRLLAWPGSISYVHTPGWTIELVLRELTRMIASGECDIAVIDYLEKASPSDRQLKTYGANHLQREANDVDLLKDFSEANGIPMFLLSQFNKFGKQVSFKELDRNAIRGAGEKSEKANVVILMQPDDVPDSRTINFKLDKNTLGPHGTWQMYADFPCFQVFDLAQ